MIPTTIVGAYCFGLKDLATSLNLSAPIWHQLDLKTGDDVAGDGPDRPRWHESFIFIASSYVEAWECLPLLRYMGKAHQVFVLIRGEHRPFPSAGPSTAPQLGTGLASSNTLRSDGYLCLRVHDGIWVDVHRAVAAVLTHQTPGSVRSLLQGLRVGMTDPAHAPWAVGDTSSTFLSIPSLRVDPSDIFPVDALISSTASFGDHVRGPRVTLEIEEFPRSDGWSSALPPINTRFISPQGFDPYPAKGTLAVRSGESGSLDLFDESDGALVASVQACSSLDESTLNSLRDRSYLDFSGVGTEVDDVQLSRLVSAAAVGGVPMLIPDHHKKHLLLGRDLVDAVTDFSSRDPDIIRESKSILMRRIALRYFEPGQRWAYWVKDSGLSLPSATVSVILATKRPGRVAEAIRQVNKQSWPEVEIVLVLHGIDLSEGELQNLKSTNERTIRVVKAEEGLVLGEALNRGVEAASGDFIAKMDDDDWYGSHHLEDLMQARRYSGADLLGSQVEFLYLEDLDITTRRPPEGERYADHVAGGTMVISRSLLRDVGGWRPVHRAVDRCLINAVESAGGLTYRGHGQNYMMHRHTQGGSHGGHTWAPDEEIFVQNSVQQWDGFVLPPQIEPSLNTATPKRSKRLRSVFTGNNSGE